MDALTEHLLTNHAPDCHGRERCTCAWFERFEELRDELPDQMPKRFAGDTGDHD